MPNTRAPRARRTPRSANASALHLIWFSFETPGTPPRRGGFHVLVRASDARHALERGAERLRTLAGTSLFEAPTSVYLEGIVELTGTFDPGVVVSFESEQQPSVKVRLTSIIPEQGTHDTQGHGPAIEDGGHVEPFIVLTGNALTDRAPIDAASMKIERLASARPLQATRTQRLSQSSQAAPKAESKVESKAKAKAKAKAKTRRPVRASRRPRRA
jgi:hypothetical protein